MYQQHEYYFFIFNKGQFNDKYGTSYTDTAQLIYHGIDGMIKYRPIELTIEEDNGGQTKTYLDAKTEI